jgi:hypothetical protein
MNYTLAAFGMLVGWVPIVIICFAIFPPRRAAIMGIIGGWLFLPPLVIPITALPDYSKITAVTFGVLLGTAIFNANVLLQFRPRWYDLPMVLWCLCPMASSLSNGLGAYDGLSQCLVATFRWGLAYLTGRLYFGSLEGLRELCLGIVAGGLIYVPFCLYEARMSTPIMQPIYGMGGWQGIRMGGYRPSVFFQTGLELGMWMTAVSLTAWWLWQSGSTKKRWNLPLVGSVPFGLIILPTLLVTTLLCRSTGALALLVFGVATLWSCSRFRSSWPLRGLILVACVYVLVRIPNLWSGASAVQIASALVGPVRAQSLEYRFQSEDLLVEHARKQPYFGWGGFNRNVAYFNEEETYQVAMDGLWIITMGVNGMVGLVLLYTIILLPVVLMIRRFPPKTWSTPPVAPAVVCATLLSIYMIDCLLNAFINLIYIVICGGLISTMPPANLALRGPRRGREELERTAGVEPALEAGSRGGIAVLDSRARRAEAYTKIARSSGGEEPEVSLAARRHALDLLGEAWAQSPEDMVLRGRWCDCANDLAWSLANHADPRLRNPEQAVELARRACTVLPNAGTYLNTLGAARVRAGDFRGAVASLERSIELGGGTGFDYGFLAMAHAKLGDHDQADHWLARAVAWTSLERPGHAELMRLCDEARISLAAGPASPVTAG